MTAAALHALREQLVAALAIVDAQLATLGGETPAPRASTDATPILWPHLKPVKSLAPMLRMTEKRLRRIAPEIGAEVRVGGRVLIDERILTAHLATGNFGQIWANSSTDTPEQISHDDCEVNR